MRFTAVISLFLLGLLLLSGCKRYEDGPVISFSSRDGRVENNWRANIFSRNDLDELGQYEYMHMDFTETQLTWQAKPVGMDTIYTYQANWELASLDRQIKTTFVSPVDSTNRLLYFDIFRLKKDELWLEYAGTKDLDLPFTRTNNRYIIRLESR